MGDEASAGRLVSRALLGAVLDRSAVLVGPGARVDIELDRPCSWSGQEQEQGQWPLTVGELAERLGIDDVDALGAALDEAGSLACHEEADPGRSVEPGPDPGCAVPLAEALRLHRAGRSVDGLLAMTATEALWTGHDPELARTALIVFVGRLPAGPRGQLYRAATAAGAAVAAGSPAALEAPDLFGDLPPAGCSTRVLAAVADHPTPRSFLLPSGELSGALTAAGSVQQADAGRLAAAGDLHTYQAARGLTLASAVSAQPMVPAWTFADPAPPPTIVMGGDLDPALAVTRCLGEAAEFLVSSSAGLLPGSVHAAADALDGAWLPADAVISHLPAQRERLGVGPFDPGEQQWWVPARRGTRPVWIPAGLVTGQLPAPPSWWHPAVLSSNGVAAHPSPGRATLGAWLELVERDAVQRARAVAGADPPARIDPASLPGTERELAAALARVAELTLLLLPGPTGIPVVMARADGEGGELVLGAGANGDPVVAVRRALIEALAQTGHRRMPISDPRLVRTPADHAALYDDLGWRERLRWMFAGPLIDVGGIAGPRVAVVPSRAAVVRYPRLGLPVEVVRVIDPLLIPLTFGHDLDPAGRPDLLTLWQRSGRPVDEPWDPHPMG